jgi:carbamoyltransferase
MRILGISSFYHDSAAAIIQDSEIVAAAQEERFTRKRHDAAFPKNAIEYCLKAAGVRACDVEYVAFYDKPFLKFERILDTYLTFAPKGFTSFQKSIPVWLKEKLFLKRLLIQELRRLDSQTDWSKRLLFSEHHLSHAASAFYPSPFDEALVLTLDGVGEWSTSSVSFGRGPSLEITQELHFPHSLGLLYSAFTYYAGFKVNSGEYKVMGLAPYGKPVFAPLILEHLMDLREDGSFRLNLDYFDFCTGLKMTHSRFDRLFGGPARKSDEPLTQRHMDLAASIQAVTEEVVLRMTRTLAKNTGTKNLCLAGGVALNCVANGKILRDRSFERIWIQPAAGDAGGAIGAALAAYYLHLKQPRNAKGNGDQMKGAYLGPSFSQEEIEKSLRQMGARFQVLNTPALLAECVHALAAGKALGWFQGRMEFGPRALGARSILGDARSPTMQSVLNLKVKHRESFRPFAPSILREDLSQWFALEVDSPYMLLVADVLPEHRLAMTAEQEKLFGIEKLNVPRSSIPAVTHVDYSARVQTVHSETNPLYHALLSEFRKKTSCPVLVNTSFNVRGEPIVCTPEDAYRCFMGTEIEALAIGNCWLIKEEQSETLQQSYRDQFEPD